MAHKIGSSAHILPVVFASTKALQIQHESNTILLRKHYEVVSITTSPDYDDADR
jgi:hypothetical protein